LQKKFVFALKSNRLVALSKEDKLNGGFHKVTELDWQSNQSYKVYLKGLDFEVLLAKQFFTNNDGSRGELFLITNDLELSYESICAIYQRRWNVENFHQSNRMRD